MLPALYKVGWHQKVRLRKIKNFCMAKGIRNRQAADWEKNTVDLNSRLNTYKLWNAFSGPIQFKSVSFKAQLYFYT